jgi:hypothetical protein
MSYNYISDIGSRLWRLILALVIIGAFWFAPNIAYAQDLGVVVKVKTPDDLDGTAVMVIENEKMLSQEMVNRKRVKLDLAFGHQYVLRFEKPGCVTKEVLVDTRNVPLHMREEYLDFGFEIELHNENEYHQSELDSLTMAQWQYITDYGMFDFERIDKCFATEKENGKKQNNLN